MPATDPQVGERWLLRNARRLLQIMGVDDINGIQTVEVGDISLDSWDSWTRHMFLAECEFVSAPVFSGTAAGANGAINLQVEHAPMQRLVEHALGVSEGTIRGWMNDFAVGVFPSPLANNVPSNLAQDTAPTNIQAPEAKEVQANTKTIWERLLEED